MTSCRANISVTVIEGKLFAVGGFSGSLHFIFTEVERFFFHCICFTAGKVFLNSVEYLDAETMEWTTFVNRTSTEDARSEASSYSRRESQITLPPVDEEIVDVKNTDSRAESSGSESDEHSS